MHQHGIKRSHGLWLKKLKREDQLPGGVGGVLYWLLQVATFFSLSSSLHLVRRGCDVRSEIRYDRNARIESCRTNNSAEVFRVAAHGREVYEHVVSIARLLILRQSATGVTKPSDVMGFRLGRLNAPWGTRKEERQKKESHNSTSIWI